MTPRYEAVIGLEVHVQLATRTKLFCGDAAVFGAPPNTHVCPVCLGLPGALPVLNVAAVELAVRTALGLQCTVQATSRFARKNYFYPDLPKGYQITQYDQPLATEGGLESGDGHGGSRRVRIRRIHLEEDAGRLLHDRLPGHTAIDLNRAGVPLIEIVTEPDLISPSHARHFLQRLRQTLEYLAVSDCDMEKGSLRVDANVSLRERGAAAPGPRTEVKNLNSFSNVERALKFEIGRQASLRESGYPLPQQTLLWDAEAGEARALRGKEQVQDYRYFPEPDLPALRVPAAMTLAASAALPELPAAKEARFTREWGLPPYDAGVLAAERGLADYFEAVAAKTGEPKVASNWVMTHVLAWSNRTKRPAAEFPVSPDRLAELLRRVEGGAVSSSAARTVLSGMIDSGRTADEIISADNLKQVRDPVTLARWVESVLEDHPVEAARVAAGDTRLMAFLMGQLMKRSGGRADPRRAAELLAAAVNRAAE